MTRGGDRAAADLQRCRNLQPSRWPSRTRRSACWPSGGARSIASAAIWSGADRGHEALRRQGGGRDDAAAPGLGRQDHADRGRALVVSETMRAVDLNLFDLSMWYRRARAERRGMNERDVVIGKAAAFPDPGRRVVEVDGIEVGVFCLNGKFTAFENVCPHMGGPVCQGKIIARVEERSPTTRPA